MEIFVTRYFFHVVNGEECQDQEGMVLMGLREAREEALLTASELLGGDGEFWSIADWAIRVTDEAGKQVFGVRVLINSP
jgi:hypothetical protein